MPQKKTAKYLKQLSHYFKHNIFLVFLSALLLVVCFPPFSVSAAAWIAVVPFLWAIQHAKRIQEAFLLGGLLGLVFFGLSISWLNYVHPVGWILLVMIEASFFALIGVAFYYGKFLPRTSLRLIWIAVAWTGIEVLRSETPLLGFGWNLIAYSQSDSYRILQFSSLLGAYGISFLIVIVNGIVFELLCRWHWQLSRGKWRYVFKRVLAVEHLNETFKLLIAMTLCFLLLLAYGKYQIKQKPDRAVPAVISVVQGNIPQDIKWSAIARQKILETYRSLTELAAKDFPDLIVWPEAAYPGYFNREPDGRDLEVFIRDLNAPVLVGSPHYEGNDVAFNSAYLVTPEQGVTQRYDKQYLVPFGEYVPLKPVLGWLEPIAYTMGVSNFSSGKAATLFHLSRRNLSFGTIICFEDVFPSLARRLVKGGADFLVVITNDAWFGPSAAPTQHLQASIFRAVENGVPIIRAANTGISGFISSDGRLISKVQDRDGRDIFVTDYKTENLDIVVRHTLYGKGGWMFGYAVLALFLLGFGGLIVYHVKVVKRKVKIEKKKMALATKTIPPKRVRKKLIKKVDRS